MSDDRFDRRDVLRASGVGLVAALAGCGGGGDGDGGGDSGNGDSDVPSRIDDFLSGSTSNYDGTIADQTGQDEVVIDVGASGNGGNRAFSPPAVRISSGTTVSFQWTGQGGLHNVVSTDDSDFDFDSGDPKMSGDPFEQSFDDTGIALYLCGPHQSAGMYGGIEIV